MIVGYDYVLGLVWSHKMNELNWGCAKCPKCAKSHILITTQYIFF